DGARRHDRRLSTLRLPRRDARRGPPLLHGGAGRALHRPDRPLQDQLLPPAPVGRPGLADRDQQLAQPRHDRREPGRRGRGGGPGGYYTQADYTSIVNYAAARYITVVPEIDMPGHTNAALASYASLNCNGVAPKLYTGTRVGFSSLCVPLELTYTFVDQVIG